MEKILPPTQCPSCDYALTWRKDILICPNSLCPAQTLKRLENHAKIMKIKGLGPASVAKLNISSISELYQLNKEEVSEYLGSTKLANKVVDQITNILNSRVDLGTFLASLGIPSVGKSIADKIAVNIDSISELNEEVLVKSGIGPKTREKIITWMRTDYFVDACSIPLSFSKPNTKEKSKGVVCITGKLHDFKNRTEAKNFLESCGYTVTNSVSKNTDYLVLEVGSRSTSKAQKAESLNIPIVNISDLVSQD